jgi:hypothetical protein
VRLEPCDPGAFLANRIHIDLAGKSLDEARDALLSGVEAYITQTLKTGPSRGFRQRPDFPGPTQPEDHPAVDAARSDADGPLKVLFIAPDVGGLSPRKQLREMQGAVDQTRHAASVRFKGVFDVHVNTLFEDLNRESPDVFHFSGKQSGGDILMRTEKGTLTTVSDMALAGMFQSLDQGLKLVIIDTCYSLRCAIRVAKVVPCAIGVEGGIYEDEAVTFYRVFYQALASGRSLKHATAQAQTALRFAKVEKGHIPELCRRPDVDPASIFLVNATSRRRPSRRG